jgi:predicted XRE-type DNA-binding protein
MSQYTGRAWREGDWWVIDVEGVGATQARTLDRVDHMARSLVADMTGSDYATVAVNVTVDLPPDVAAQVETLRRKSEEAAAAAQEAAELQAQIVAFLTTDAGLTGREVAAILKVTPGRVSQIARKASVRRDVAKSA